MKKLEVKDLKENFFEAIGKEWMLVTAGTKEKFNTMTASWGGIGWLWNKPVAFVFIRPERYTYEFLEENDHLTLSFLGEENKKIHAVCGSKSGRNIDKVKETGLKPVFTEKGNVLFEQARLSLECKKLYADAIKPECFLDKESLEDEFNELSLQYEGYKFNIGNDSLLNLLSTEQAKVQRLQEELRTVKATNTKEIARLKKELQTLRKIMRNYVVQIDSLNRANEQLKVEKNEAVKKYKQASSTATTLKKEKEKLTERVTLASRLDATGINVTPVNGRGKKAKVIKKMEQFVVDFRISKNITAPVGEKTIYVRIMKPDDDILLKSRADVFTFEGKEINYSMKKLVEYDGEELPVTMYWNIEEFLSPGTYRVDIFADGNLIGRKSFTLEK